MKKPRSGAVIIAVYSVLFRRGWCYGQQLVTEAGFPSGSVYPALGRLERDGHITSRLVASQLGPARKYYRLSREGYKELAETERAWNNLVRAMEPILSTPVPSQPKEAAR